MLIKTLFNKIFKFKSFVYEKVHLEEDEFGNLSLVAKIVPRKNAKIICSGCGQPAPGYDKRGERKFEHAPLYGIKVFLSYQMRRVNCPQCKVVVEKVPWADGKSTQTRSFQLFLAHWAKKLSWKETAESFNVTWHKVFESVKMCVKEGLSMRSLEGIEAIGIDEIHFGKGHSYLTLVYEICANRKRLLFTALGHGSSVLDSILDNLTPERCAKIKFVCTDMWAGYLKSVREKLPNALNILDPFHIVKNLNKAVDEVRKEEARKFSSKGFHNPLAKTKYIFLKHPENLTAKQKSKLKEVVKYDLKTVNAYMHAQTFRLFWKYVSPYWAKWFLHKWCKRIMHTDLEPLKKFVKTLRKHEDLLMNYFKAKKAYNSGVVEGLNRKINLTTRKAYGFKSLETLEIALFHTMGNLPEPKSTHRFW